MNKDLLLRTAAAIEANPKHFDMDKWFGTKKGCGTTACIVGWAIHLHRADAALGDSADAWLNYEFTTHDMGIEILGIDSDLFGTLVYDFAWRNSELKHRFQEAKTPQKRAEAAADYVRWFVETFGEKENEFVR